MADKKIERKFKPRVGGGFQPINDFKDFKEIEIGQKLMILLEKGKGFSAYFEGVEPTRKMQKVFLQYDLKMPFWPHAPEMPQVRSYFLPLEGPIKIKNFTEGWDKTYSVD